MKDRPMKIAFDAKRITHNRTGLGNYGRTLVNNLSTYYPENEYLLYSPDPGNDQLREQVITHPNVKFIYPEKKKKGLGKSVWRSWGILKDLDKEQPDLFHGLSAELPFGIKKSKVNSVVTIHDLIFLRYPKLYNPLDRIIYTYKYKKACQEADRIVAISKTTKEDIINYFKIDPDKIDIVYQGCDNAFKRKISAEAEFRIKGKYQLPVQYILYVGTIEERKNLLLVVKALHLLQENIHLVVVGKKTPYADTVINYIQEHNLQKQVSVLNNVPFEDLPGLYQMASLFVYPSRFEGFGIPVLEALCSATPVIACTGSCLEEAGGPDSIYISPDDEKGLAKAIQSVLSDPEKQNQMIEAGLHYAVRFNDDVLAKEMMQVYYKVIERK